MAWKPNATRACRGTSAYCEPEVSEAGQAIWVPWCFAAGCLPDCYQACSCLAGCTHANHCPPHSRMSSCMVVGLSRQRVARLSTANSTLEHSQLQLHRRCIAETAWRPCSGGCLQAQLPAWVLNCQVRDATPSPCACLTYCAANHCPGTIHTLRLFVQLCISNKMHSTVSSFSSHLNVRACRHCACNDETPHLPQQVSNSPSKTETGKNHPTF